MRGGEGSLGCRYEVTMEYKGWVMSIKARLWGKGQEWNFSLLITLLRFPRDDGRLALLDGFNYDLLALPLIISECQNRSSLKNKHIRRLQLP